MPEHEIRTLSDDKKHVLVKIKNPHPFQARRGYWVLLDDWFKFNKRDKEKEKR